MNYLPCSVFVIDDDRNVRNALTQAFEFEGFSVEAFDRASSALAKLQYGWAGVVVSDINMPMMDGLEFLKQAMQIDSDFAVIMLTGHGDISKAVESMKLGAYDFLEKPFSIERIVDSINKSYELRSLVLENRQLKDEVDAQS